MWWVFFPSVTESGVPTRCCGDAQGKKLEYLKSNLPRSHTKPVLPDDDCGKIRPRTADHCAEWLRSLQGRKTGDARGPVDQKGGKPGGNRFSSLSRKSTATLFFYFSWGLAQPFRNLFSRVPRPCRCVLCRDRAGNLTSCNLRHNSELLPLPRGPLRLNFHHSLNSRKIVTEAAPSPLLRTRHQSSLHRIAMDVAQLLDSLGFAPNIEVVVSRLPERSALHLAQLTGDILLQHCKASESFALSGSLARDERVRASPRIRRHRSRTISAPAQEFAQSVRPCGACRAAAHDDNN